MPENDDLTLALAGNYDGIASRILEVDVGWAPDGVAASGRFLRLPVRDGEFTVSEFVQYFYWRLPSFCFPRKECQRAVDRLRDTGDLRYTTELADRARELFIRAPRQAGRTGEPGELALFTILEGLEGCPQVACKMYLKTSAEMPVHGTDGIHVRMPGSARAGVTLIWGESKVYQNLASALDAVCESLVEFIGTPGSPGTRRHDLRVLRDHLDVPEGPAREAILDALDPYSDTYNSVSEEFACFVAFEFPGCELSTTESDAEAEAAFIARYEARVRTACDLFRAKVIGAGLERCRFRLFLLPLPEVAEFRAAFMRHLGGSNAH